MLLFQDVIITLYADETLKTLNVEKAYQNCIYKNDGIIVYIFH